MHRMKLVPDRPYSYKCDITVYDVTGGTEKKRCMIDVDYAENDIEELKKQGLDMEGAADFLEKRIYETVKRYILDDWEYAGGHEEIMDIIREHIAEYF